MALELSKQGGRGSSASRGYRHADCTAVAAIAAVAAWTANAADADVAGAAVVLVVVPYLRPIPGTS